LFFFFLRVISYKRAIFLVLFLFLTTTYIFTFSILRNYLALIFLLLSIIYINRSPFFSILFIIIGSLLHITVLLFGIIIFLLNGIKIRAFLIGILVTLFVLGFIDYRIVLSMLISLLDFIRPDYNYYEVIEISANPSLTLISIFSIYSFFLLGFKSKVIFFNSLLLKLSLLFLFMSIFLFWIPNFYRLALLAIFCIGFYILVDLSKYKLKYPMIYEVLFFGIFFIFFFMNFNSNTNSYDLFF